MKGFISETTSRKIAPDEIIYRFQIDQFCRLNVTKYPCDNPIVLTYGYSDIWQINYHPNAILSVPFTILRAEGFFKSGEHRVPAVSPGDFAKYRHFYLTGPPGIHVVRN